MPCNLYGPNDNYNPENSHFLPALISKIYSAKIKKKKYFELWGTGKPKRELMYVDDLADACIFFLNKKTKETLINVGSGIEMKIIDYAKLIVKILKTDLQIKFDTSKPDGTPRKIVDTNIAKKYGWKSKISFERGLKLTYQDFLENI
jgi:GDP-L-fucose synthase